MKGNTYKVHLRGMSCECGFIHQSGVPCRHFLVVVDLFRNVFQLSAECFHPVHRTELWHRMYHECPSFTGVFPSEARIADVITLRAQPGAPPLMEVKAWNEIDEVRSISSKRLRSVGEAVGGATVTRTKLKKRDKRPCLECTKIISGFTLHPPTACLAYTGKCAKQLEAHKKAESVLCFTFSSEMRQVIYHDHDE